MQSFLGHLAIPGTLPVFRGGGLETPARRHDKEAEVAYPNTSVCT